MTVRRINCKVDLPLTRQSAINEPYSGDFHADISEYGLLCWVACLENLNRLALADCRYRSESALWD
ncbi:MAG: hypothetical protein IPN42_14515 [Methylococcaceae bacterium]|nr:hypothetical protein [Methylococcaceae bacterium]